MQRKNRITYRTTNKTNIKRKKTPTRPIPKTRVKRKRVPTRPP
jgi:hypothetical protein